MGVNGFKTLSLQNVGSLWTLKIDRPEALNALNSQVMNELAEAIRFISEMDYENARGLIITGSGEKAFVAGADIKELAALSRDEAEAFARRGQSIFHELALFKIPVIAAVNGFALGGGCELALACDFIYASENAKFGLPEVTLGLIPGFGGTVRLSRAVGIRRAREMTLSGEIISAAEALQIGLINKIFPLADLHAAAFARLQLIASRAPQAVAKAKKSILHSWDLEVEEAQKLEAQYFSELFELSDTKEGLNAFIEKRKPIFKGE